MVPCYFSFEAGDWNFEPRDGSSGTIMKNASDAARSSDPASLERDGPAVTKIVDRIPLAGRERELEHAIKALIAAALHYPGHMGVTVSRPALPYQPGFRLVYRFDTCEHLKAWEQSSDYAELSAEANRHTQGEPQRQTFSGLEVWFTHPAHASQAAPPRERIAVVTWLGIFPLVYAFSTLIPRLLPEDTPSIVNVVVVTMLVVLMMTYAVAPLLTKLFAKWLRPTRHARDG